MKHSSWKPKLICGVIALSSWAFCSYLPGGMQIIYSVFACHHSVLELDFKNGIELVVPLLVFVVMTPFWCLWDNALLKLATGRLSQQAGEKAEAPSRRNQFPPHSLSPSTGLVFWHAKNLGPKPCMSKNRCSCRIMRATFTFHLKKRNIYSICRCQSLKTRNHKLAFQQGGPQAAAADTSRFF